jgi:Domain of unknown function (DUF1707)/Cell wall-active antibiotics response 4TMS YvqF
MTHPLPSPSELSVDRERVIALLTHHFANDNLTEVDFEARLQSAYAATSTRELEAITADLPAHVQGAEITASLSGQERKLVGALPRELALRARLGYVELDLTQASFKPGVTTINARAFMGYVEIRLPAGVRVDSAGRALFGFFSLKGEPSDSGPVVRIVGRPVFGFVEAIIAPNFDAD